ncbi:glycoside hydrolase family 5 protein [Laccaria amethystina LaAM-08-1]|uniref:Glycoside hydrolase family 5 protein n=1 Tax=Laccaria amethystina LaAM-08-1 TaxID=1095629 RepID=A0A0C9X079_9AGAR|nr:glycoside hydrolase family 5 protein [Laccaria amethystina LaAM-08-1]
MSGARTTLRINPLFFRKTTSAKTRSLERRSWTERVRTVTSQDKLIFVEPIPNEFCSTSLAEQPLNMVARSVGDLKGVLGFEMMNE